MSEINFLPGQTLENIVNELEWAGIDVWLRPTYRGYDSTLFVIAWVNRDGQDGKPTPQFKLLKSRHIKNQRCAFKQRFYLGEITARYAAVRLSEALERCTDWTPELIQQLTDMLRPVCIEAHRAGLCKIAPSPTTTTAML